MKSNVGKVDQTIRYILAIVLIVIAVIGNSVYESNLFLWLLIPAIILGFTAAISWCALYRLFGLDTCKYDK